MALQMNRAYAEMVEQSRALVSLDLMASLGKITRDEADKRKFALMTEWGDSSERMQEIEGWTEEKVKKLQAEWGREHQNRGRRGIEGRG